MRATFSEEDGALEGILVETRGCPYALRSEMERELTEFFGVPVTVTERSDG